MTVQYQVIDKERSDSLYRWHINIDMSLLALTGQSVTDKQIKTSTVYQVHLYVIIADY